MLTIDSPVSTLKGIGPANVKRLKNLGLEKILDLVYYFPVRWDDFSNIIKINRIKPHEICTIKGKVQLINNRRSFRKKMFVTESLIADDTGSVKVVWFNQPYLIKILRPGDQIVLSGKVDMDYLTPEFLSPSFEKIKKEQTHTGRIVPVYSLTSGLTQRQLRFYIRSALAQIEEIRDFLPLVIKNRYGLINLPLALKQIHFPDSKEISKKAQARLKFDELFLIQAQAWQNKLLLKNSKAPKVKFLEKTTKEFVKSLPFTLTLDQKKSAWEILKDLEKNNPMNRLLNGDVGSGKTVVAVMAALNCIKNGFQTAYMAPTEVLARQNYETMKEFLKPFNINACLLTSSLVKMNHRNSSKRTVLKKIGNNQAALVCGTHALIQEKVVFNNLALVIVDEQHRFGVAQRKTLRKKASKENKFMPHLLSMTATPIPRTMALTVYADLDLSIIKEMPGSRKKVITKIIPLKKRVKAYQFIRKEIKEGRQAFVICPLIEASDKLGVKSVKQEYEKLANEIFYDLKIRMLHGKLKPGEKEKIMDDFKDNKINILVSTSVIEVGIDIPNATVMMIEGSERFGLSQLHQFRGRVGRGKHQSYLFLFTESDNPKTRERLEAIEKSEDGFKLAEYDLKQRGPGEIAGLKQSGLPDFRMASLSDIDTIKKARTATQEIFEKDPKLETLPQLKQRISEFQEEIHWE